MEVVSGLGRAGERGRGVETVVKGGDGVGVGGMPITMAFVVRAWILTVRKVVGLLGWVGVGRMGEARMVTGSGGAAIVRWDLWSKFEGDVCFLMLPTTSEGLGAEGLRDLIVRFLIGQICSTREDERNSM